MLGRSKSIKSIEELSKQIDEEVSNRTPTTKKVLNMIQPPADMSRNQKLVFSQLKMFIKSCSHEMLKNFLRFCTGKLWYKFTN